MSRASEVLRERANDRVGADPDELRALADLLEATAVYIAWTEGEGRGESGHDTWLRMRNTLAAAERAITGERE